MCIAPARRRRAASTARRVRPISQTCRRRAAAAVAMTRCVSCRRSRSRRSPRLRPRRGGRCSRAVECPTAKVSADAAGIPIVLDPPTSIRTRPSRRAPSVRRPDRARAVRRAGAQAARDRRALQAACRRTKARAGGRARRNVRRISPGSTAPAAPPVAPAQKRVLLRHPVRRTMPVVRGAAPAARRNVRRTSLGSTVPAVSQAVEPQERIWVRLRDLRRAVVVRPGVLAAHPNAR